MNKKSCKDFLKQQNDNIDFLRTKIGDLYNDDDYINLRGFLYPIFENNLALMGCFLEEDDQDRKRVQSITGMPQSLKGIINSLIDNRLKLTHLKKLGFNEACKKIDDELRMAESSINQGLKSFQKSLENASKLLKEVKIIE